MASIVYLLCAITSAACAALLIRSFSRTRVRLLLWTSLCFVGLALNSALLVVDLVIVPFKDLAVLRTAVALGSMLILLFGLIWESE
jgi:hypothetical protein